MRRGRSPLRIDQNADGIPEVLPQSHGPGNRQCGGLLVGLDPAGVRVAQTEGYSGGDFQFDAPDAAGFVRIVEPTGEASARPYHESFAPAEESRPLYPVPWKRVE